MHRWRVSGNRGTSKCLPSEVHVGSGGRCGQLRWRWWRNIWLPGHEWPEGGSGVETGANRIAKAKRISAKRGRVVKYTPLNCRCLAIQPELRRYLVGLLPASRFARAADPISCLPNIQMPPVGQFHHAIPPRNQQTIVCRRVAEVPIQLRGNIIEPTRLNPLPRVGINVVIALQPIGSRAVGLGGSFVLPDTKRRNPKLHPGFGNPDAVAHLLHEQVHVVASPVGPVGKPPVVAHKRRIVVEGSRSGGGWVGIKVIVEMHPVDVVPAHHIHNNPSDIASNFGQSRVQNA